MTSAAPGGRIEAALFEFFGPVLVVAGLVFVGEEVEVAVVGDAVCDELAGGFVELDAVDT